MKRILAEKILPALDDSSMRFVFISEVSAVSMLHAALAASKKKALQKNRFVSWDTFKAEVFAPAKHAEPVNKSMRSLFAYTLCGQNAREPFLREYIPERMASVSSRFAPSIAASLPSLIRLKHAAYTSGYISDWRAILARYEEFLSDNALYEPSWLYREAARQNTASWLLVYPDLAEDWDEYAEAVAAIPNTETLLAARLEAIPVAAKKYGTALEEIRAVIISALDTMKTCRASDIAFSIAAPDTMLPLFEREAAIAGLPLDIHDGKPLSESAGGLLIKDIVSCAADDFSFEALRRLLLNPSRPWKHAAAISELIETGIQRRVVTPRIPRADGGRAVRQIDVWDDALSNKPEARDLYRGLRTNIQALCGARDFGELRSRFEKFKKIFLRDEAWTQEQNDEISRCVLVLDELRRAAERIHIRGAEGIPCALTIYTELLSETRYVPVGTTGGAAVYRFPVAVSSAPRIHYCINMTEAAASVAARPLSFMRADERDRLGARDKDLSSALVRVAARSGGCVHISCSETGPEGVRAPHSVLAVHTDSGYRREAWLPNLETKNLHASPVFASQAASAAAALVTVLSPNKENWTDGKPSHPVIPQGGITIPAKKNDGRLVLSATSIESYMSCSFKRAFSDSLCIEPLTSGISLADNILLGKIYHSAFAQLFQALADSKTAISEGIPDGSAVSAAFDEALRIETRREGLVTKSFLGMIKRRLRAHFYNALAILLPELRGAVPIMSDNTELYADISPSLALEGRPDLVCEKNDGGKKSTIIVDFKKSVIPSGKELEPAADGSLSHIQLPVYAFLVRGSQPEPEAAYYVSVEKAKMSAAPVSVLSGAPFMPLAERACDIVARSLMFVPEAADAPELCARCELRPVCRARYVIR